jgi:hypothetical protein
MQHDIFMILGFYDLHEIKCNSVFLDICYDFWVS